MTLRLLRFLLATSAFLACYPLLCACQGPSAGQLGRKSPPTDTQAARFTDTTRASGLYFKQSSGECGMAYFVEQVTTGAAVFDANGDGYPDIYFPQCKPLGACIGKVKGPFHQHLFLNDGKGHFTLSKHAFPGETEYGMCAAIGDYDNDGHPDLYVTCYGGNTLYHNRGDGTFEDVTRKAGVRMGGLATGAVFFDYDKDGFMDLYVNRYCEWTVATDMPCPGPNNTRDACNPQVYTPARSVLFHNNRNGTFTDVTKRALLNQENRRGLGVAAADFDNDGWLDLFSANDLGPNYLFHNKGNGTFEDVAMQQSVAFGITGRSQANMGVAVGDYNDDGRLDVLVSTFAKEPKTLYRNDGDFFTDVSGPTGIGPAAVDYLCFGNGLIDTRNLGRLDVFLACGHVSPSATFSNSMKAYREKNILLLNNGNGQWTEAQGAMPQDDVKVHRGAMFGDFDGDGRLDILTTATNDYPELLHNESAGTGNWLYLRLTDKHGCVTPVGARCTATIGSRKLLRVLLGGGGYGGDSDQKVHFGLGDAAKVDRLEIRWLSGQTTVLTNVQPNQILNVREPK